MVGILSYGVYIPMWRIEREEIAKAVGTMSGGGSGAVASRDEDSLTQLDLWYPEGGFFLMAESRHEKFGLAQ